MEKILQQFTSYTKYMCFYKYFCEDESAKYFPCVNKISYLDSEILSFLYLVENMRTKINIQEWISSWSYLSIYKFGLSVCLFVCLSVCLYPKNVKTAEPIGPKFFVGHLGTPGKIYEWSKFQIFVSIKIRSSLNLWKFWKSTTFFVKIRELFLFCFTM